jgi:hypothetical protein
VRLTGWSVRDTLLSRLTTRTGMTQDVRSKIRMDTASYSRTPLGGSTNKLSSSRRSFELATMSEISFRDNVFRQDYLLTRATKV